MSATAQSQAPSQAPGRLQKVAGWDLPLDHHNSNPGCLQPIWSSDMPIAVREMEMMRLVNAVTDKPEWQRKVFDADIVGKWRAEMVKSDDNSRDEMTTEVFDWCITELRDKAKIYEKDRFVRIFDTDLTAAKSDDIVSEALREELKAACQPLLDVPEAAKDYHPGSDGQVLNLVHPSLFPLVYGKSRVLEEGKVPLRDCSSVISKGKILPVIPADENVNRHGFNCQVGLWSHKYQWLPSDIRFDDDGKARIDSYINNLHPVGNEAVYGVLEKFVDVALPMWNACLPVFSKEREARITNKGEGLWDPDEPDSSWKPPPKPKTGNEDEDDDDDDDWDDDNNYVTHWHETRRLILPKPRPYKEWKQAWRDEPDLQRDFKDSGLQVIFKLASIELSPDKPTYDGGSWHIEGQLNEHIVATAIYYYDCENISESLLSFRRGWSNDADLVYEQNDHEGLIKVFGLEDWTGDALQVLGNAVTKQGRMLVFPNNYHHQVQSFELSDRTKPGHRRFLVMWLVDPWNRVLSTANVPPQQRDWWMRELVRTQSITLPAELTKMVGDAVDDFPMSMEEAKERRLELMEERTSFAAAADGYRDGFSLCEH